MQTLKKLTGILFFLSLGLNSFSQTFFKEDFEGATADAVSKKLTRMGWNNNVLIGPHNWKFENGGFSINPTVPNSRNPKKAHAGKFNALYYVMDLNSKARLITPNIDLSISEKPMLSFWVANFERYIQTWVNNDKLKVYYRTNKNSEWILLHEILEKHEQWKLINVMIPDDAHSKTFQLAFEGISGPGWGMCIDDISIVETAIKPKYIAELNVTQVEKSVIVATGTKTNPILRLDITVKGNKNKLNINKLVVDALNNCDKIVPANGVQMYFTRTSYFTADSILQTTSFVNGKATFQDIDFDLPFGEFFIWVTYDVEKANTQGLMYKKLDGKIYQNNFIVNNKQVLKEDLDPSGHRKVYESLFFDDFETVSGKWNLTGEFQIEKPKGLGQTEIGNPDPNFARSGKQVLGTDLTGLGTFLGDYENDITEDNPYSATIVKDIDCEYYKDVNLLFFQYLNIEPSDNAKIQIQNEKNGKWITVWEKSDNFIFDGLWKQRILPLNELAYRKKHIKTRIILGPTSDHLTASGWNIDDFAITGTFIKKDVNLVSITSPQQGCGHSGPEELTIRIKNSGYEDLSANIPIGYSLDGGENWTMDKIDKTIAKGQEIQFTFAELIDISAPENHQIMVKTFFDQDDDESNNEIDTTISVLPICELPYNENFENGDGFWRVGGSDSTTWELAKPSGTKLNSANSGNFAWITNATGKYKNSDNSWIESPCFDFRKAEKPIVEFMLAADCQANTDGLAVYYSLDNGETWKYIPKEQAYDWNWANKDISSLGVKGWDNTPSNQYIQVKQTLPNEVRHQYPVKLRFVFASNETTAAEGVAIDDIKIYEAPMMIEPISIVSPQSSCNLTANEHIKFAIKNKGNRALKQGEQLSAVLTQEEEVIDTQLFTIPKTIEIGQNGQFTFDKTVDLTKFGVHNFTIEIQEPEGFNIYNGATMGALTTSITMQGELDYTLGPKIGTTNASSISLDAKRMFPKRTYTGYEWTKSGDASWGVKNTQIINNVGAGIFNITVTNNYGCTATSSIEVVGTNIDLGIASMSGITTGCASESTNSPDQRLTVTIKNFSPTKKYNNGDKIVVGYQINDEEVHTENYIVSGGEMGQDAERTFTFSEPLIFTEDGETVVKAFTVNQPELNYDNDTAKTNIEIYPMPEIQLEDDEIYTDMSQSIELDAGTGFSSYNWYINDDEQTTHSSKFTVTSKLTSTYKVTAKDDHNCGIAKDSVLVITDNWSIKQVINPKSNCSLTDKEDITLTVKNNSENIYPIKNKLPVSININGKIINSDIIFPKKISGNEEYTATLTKKVNLKEDGEYNIGIKLNPKYDIDTNNNTYNVKVENYNVPQLEIEGLADTVITKLADTILLQVPDKFQTYEWHMIGVQTADSLVSHNYKYQIDKKTSNLYKIQSLDKHNCGLSKDSVYIMASDLTISSIKSPKSICKLKNVSKIEFALRNDGNDIIGGGTPMAVQYNINGGAWIKKDFTLPEDLKPNQETIISIPENIQLQSGNEYIFSLDIIYKEDLFTDNNIKTVTIQEFGKLNVDLGDDVIYTTDPTSITLDAGAGYDSYYWNDSDNTINHSQTFKVNKEFTKTYRVVVSNYDGCSATDSVLIFTKDIFPTIEEGTENMCDVGEKQVTININILGQDTLKFDTPLKAWYRLNNESIVEEDLFLGEELTVDKPYKYEFTTKANVITEGDYTLTTGVKLPHDVEPSNNSTNDKFKVGGKKVNLGEDVVTYDTEYTFIVKGFLPKKKWCDKEKNFEEITVTESGKYWIEVTDEDGCVSKDTVNVTFIKAAYTIADLTDIVNGCASPEERIMKFTLVNSGNDVLKANTKLKITYSINTNVIETLDYTLDEDLSPSTQKEIQFNETYNFANPGIYTIKIQITKDGEMLTAKQTQVDIWDVPIVELGNDIRTTDNSVTLDAGAGFTSYLWNTGATTQTIKVEESNTYKVTVTNDKGCSSSDEIRVDIIPLVLSVELNKPKQQAGCTPVTTTPKITLKNIGEKEIPAGTNLTVAYQVDDGEKQSETVDITSGMPPKSILKKPFNSHPLNITKAGPHTLTFMIIYAGKEVGRFKFDIQAKQGTPFSFGKDTITVSSYPYTLDPNVNAKSYKWNTGAETKTLTVEANGTYSLTTTSNNGCKYSASVYVYKGAVGLNDQWIKDMKIYPNPASDKIHIEMPEFIPHTNIKITNTDGKLILKQKNIDKNNVINLDNWKQGIYLMHIKNKKHNAVIRFVIQ